MCARAKAARVKDGQVIIDLRRMPCFLVINYTIQTTHRCSFVKRALALALAHALDVTHPYTYIRAMSFVPILFSRIYCIYIYIL